MSWQTVFEGDMLSVRRSRLGLGVSAAVIALTAGMAVLLGLVAGTDPSGNAGIVFGDLLMTVAFVGSLFLPFVAMLASYSAIVHEREHGSIRFLLGLPNSRAEAYVGKLLSRSVLFTLPCLAGLALVGLVGFALLPEGDVAKFGAISVLVLVYGLVFIGFGLSLSGILGNETSATTGIISVWLLFRLGWPGIQYGALRLIEGQQFSQPYPEWYFWLGRVNPMNAFMKLVYTALNTPPGGRPLITNPHPSVSTVATSDWFAAVVLVGWLGIAPLIGFLKFRDADLL